MKKILTSLLLPILIPVFSYGQSAMLLDYKPATDSLKVLLQERTTVRTGLSIHRIMRRGKYLDFYFERNIGDYPWTEKDVKWFRKTLGELTPEKYRSWEIGEIFSGSTNLISLSVPLPGNSGKPADNPLRVEDRKGTPLVTPKSGLTFNKGLSGRHIALWQSHGRYFEAKTDRWEWQRACIHRTVEDMYTQSYVLPFLIPMLENAGAVVMTPRERDTQRFEVICDNDRSFTGGGPLVRTHGSYRENGNWSDAGEGFADAKEVYTMKDNPFRMGSARKLSGKGSATWTPDIPERGEYAVYVSYKTIPGVSSAAKYSVKHLGGTSDFSVNQTMGGGIWIYLGTFEFAEGTSGNVTLTSGGETVTADAVRFGGGIGKIARGSDPDDDSFYTTSGLPCFTEGALYSMQFSGLDMDLFKEWDSDYTKDYAGRGKWVSYLSGGSSVNPSVKGLGIPFDLSLAFHTDAGTTPDDSIVGTLSIYTSVCENSRKLPDGESRLSGRQLAGIVQTQIVDDVRAEFEPEWSRRMLWDRSYSESRTPSVPAMLLEFLSHQNFADMKYGLDPAFRFTVSRGIYKGMLKYLSSRYGVRYAVQPLPVKDFSVKLDGKSAVLSWAETPDTLETTAGAEGLILYTRKDDGGFDNGKILKGLKADASGRYTTRVNLDPGVLYSFKIVAWNDGGKSFPSEILCSGIPSDGAKEVIVVNDFTRLSAPAWFDTPTYAGFVDNLDSGVPYGKEINFIGEVFDFNRKKPWTDDDNPGFGGSYADRAGNLAGGNTFDFVAAHARILFVLGYAVSSSSASAFDGSSDAFALDLVCGKQLTTKIGRGAVPDRYQVFPIALQNALKSFSSRGGNILVSGSYIGTDVSDKVYDIESEPYYKETAEAFTSQVLGYKWLTNFGSRSGSVTPRRNNALGLSSPVHYNKEFRPDIYRVENPDGILPASDRGSSIMYYTDSNVPAATVFTAPDHKAAAFGFPLETLPAGEARTIFEGVMQFFEK